MPLARQTRQIPSILSARRALAALVLAAASLAPAREIVDMAGREVVVPDTIRRIYAAQPYTNVILYMVAPELSIGQLTETTGPEKRFLRPEFAAKPVLGAAPGQGKEANLEAVLAARPDFVLLKGGTRSDPARATEKYQKLGIPVVFVDLENIDDYPAGLEFLGKLLGREAKTAKMAAFARRILSEVDKAVAGIPPQKRLRVYYAESPDGLATECDQSFHADAIKRAGGKIVHECLLKTHMGMEKVGLEQVLVYDPDVIVSNDAHFEAAVYKDPRWSKVKAVAAHKVWTVPRTPFNWIDRPPSLTRLAGIPWLAHHFYPKAVPGDLRDDLLEFHQLFLGTTPLPADLDAWTR
jgi:iron complex transport system substrate-binding protein